MRMRRDRPVERCREEARDLRVSEEDTDLGIDVERARVEIHRADEHAAPVEDHALGVQGGLLRPAEPVPDALCVPVPPSRAVLPPTGSGLYLVELDPRLEQRPAVALVARVDR